MARPGSKRQIIIDIMTENVNNPMDHTVEIIQNRLNLKRADARLYYIDLVEAGLAPGIIERLRNSRPRIYDKSEEDRQALIAASPTVKYNKVSKEKVKKEKTPKPPKETKLAPVIKKTTEEMAKIRENNLAKLKAVHQVFKAKQGMSKTDVYVPELEEVNTVYKEIVGDDIDDIVPKFLRKSFNIEY
jgi:hypothetical protein